MTHNLWLTDLFSDKNRRQQKDKLNQETYQSVIHKALKRILKLTVNLRKQGIITDPSIDLITRKSLANMPSTKAGIHGLGLNRRRLGIY